MVNNAYFQYISIFEKGGPIDAIECNITLHFWQYFKFQDVCLFFIFPLLLLHCADDQRCTDGYLPAQPWQRHCIFRTRTLSSGGAVTPI